MGRLFGMLAAIVAYVSIATVLAASTGVAYLRMTGKLDNQKLNNLLTVARGETLPKTGSEHAAPVQPIDREQTSFEEHLEARGLVARNLELREQALKSGLQLVQAEKDIVLNEKDRFDGRVAAFKKQLESMRAEVLESGRENVRQLLENMKPKQAKEQILKMIEANEMDEVVVLLSSLPTTKQAKIVGEFKTAEESVKLNEILRLIRQSVPQVSLIGQAEKQVQ